MGRHLGDGKVYRSGNLIRGVLRHKVRAKKRAGLNLYAGLARVGIHHLQQHWIEGQMRFGASQTGHVLDTDIHRRSGSHIYCAARWKDSRRCALGQSVTGRYEAQCDHHQGQADPATSRYRKLFFHYSLSYCYICDS